MVWLFRIETALAVDLTLVSNTTFCKGSDILFWTLWAPACACMRTHAHVIYMYVYMSVDACHKWTADPPKVMLQVGVCRLLTMYGEPSIKCGSCG